MQVTVIGCGYVGLVTGAGFAETGTTVTCVDIDAGRIASLNRGEIPIFEPGLDTLVARNTQAGRLTFSSDIHAAIAAADVVFIAVGTPPRADGAADLQAVDRVAESICHHASKALVVALKSTVPVGTANRVKGIVKDCLHPIHVVSNPEFLKEGNAVNDFLRPDRVVIGCDSDDHFARNLMQRLYHPVTLNRDRIVWMRPASAELTKYAANTMLATRISMMNEVAALCEKVGADVHEVRQGVGTDSRIGSKFLYAGPGYGGSCFPKDVKALVQTGRDFGIELELAAVTDRVNDRQKGLVARKLRRHFAGSLRGHTVAVWGLSFKPQTDDIREAPALHLIDTLLAEGAKVSAHDPCAHAHVAQHYGKRIQLNPDAYAAVQGAEALVLMTEWRQYQNPDFKRLRATMARPLLLDARNIWSRYGLRKLGFVYDGIGVQGS